MPPTFHIESFGCRAARADAEAIASLLRASGAQEQKAAEADVVIVNTCSVTAEADREARAYIRRSGRLNPATRIIATGCYAQRAPEELAAIPGVVAVIGNSHKALVPEVALQHTFPHLSQSHTLVSPSTNPASGTSTETQIVRISTLLAASHNHPLILSDDSFAHSFLEEAPILPGTQTRPNLKIQEGCSNRCSFCVIPQTRGNSRSLPAESVLAHVRHFVSAAGNELVLSGINLGRWGRDRNASESPIRTLADLVRAIFSQTDLPRLRLSSIEPMDWDADLIRLMSDFGRTRLACHAHLPLQSGSDSVLRRMHRRYRPWHYAEKAAALLRAAGPSLTLGADVMVGFPGETDREFQESCDFIRSLPLGYLHLFPFSPRPNTRAFDLHAASPVPACVVDERIAALRDLIAEKTRVHRAQFVGHQLDAITLNTPPALAAAHRTAALTQNFLPVECASRLPANQLIRIHVNSLAPDSTLLASVSSPNLSASQFDFSAVQPIEPVLENSL